MAEKYAVVMTLTDLEIIASGLKEARLPCPEQDCFSCVQLAELERKIRAAIDAKQQ